MSDYLGHYFGRDGYRIVGLDGYCWDPVELEPESQAPALDVPTTDVEPETVQDNEIHREIES